MNLLKSFSFLENHSVIILKSFRESVRSSSSENSSFINLLKQLKFEIERQNRSSHLDVELFQLSRESFCESFEISQRNHPEKTENGKIKNIF